MYVHNSFKTHLHSIPSLNSPQVSKQVNLTPMLKYLTACEPLPENLKAQVIQNLPRKVKSKNPFRAHLYEIDSSLKCQAKCRYAVIFQTRDEVFHFLSAWKEGTNKRAIIEKYIVVQNVVLLFLRSQIKVGTLMKQICYFGCQPIFILAIRQMHKEFEAAKEGDIGFNVKWAFKPWTAPRKQIQLTPVAVKVDQAPKAYFDKSLIDLPPEQMLNRMEEEAQVLIKQIETCQEQLQAFITLTALAQVRIDELPQL